MKTVNLSQRASDSIDTQETFVIDQFDYDFPLSIIFVAIVLTY